MNELSQQRHEMFYPPLSKDTILKQLFSILQSIELQIHAFNTNEEDTRKALQDIQRDEKVAEKKYLTAMHNTVTHFQISREKTIEEWELATNDITDTLNKTIYWSFMKHDSGFNICQGLVEVDKAIRTIVPAFKDLSYLLTGLTNKIKESKHPLDSKKYLYQFTKSFIENHNNELKVLHNLQWIETSKDTLSNLMFVNGTTVRSVTGYFKTDGKWHYADNGTRAVHGCKQKYYQDYIEKLSQPSDLKIRYDELHKQFEPNDITRMMSNVQTQFDIHLRNFTVYVHNCCVAMNDLDTAIILFDADKKKEEYKLRNILKPFFDLITTWLETLFICINTLTAQQYLFNSLAKELALMSSLSRRAGFLITERTIGGF